MVTTATSINPRVIEMNGTAIFKNQTSDPKDRRDFLLDSQWGKQAFLVSDAGMDPNNVYDIKNRYWSSASTKFTDSRIGGNIGINARPAFTRYSDIRSKGRVAGRSDVGIQNVNGNHGMGRYYSEAIDDPAQTISLRFGTPKFNSIANFFSKAFDPEMTALARTGRSTSFLFDLGTIVGTVAAVSAFPALAGTILVGKTLASFFTKPTSKFYTMKPSMHTYWSAVETLVSTIGVNKGILPRILTDDSVEKGGVAKAAGESSDQRVGSPYKFDKAYLDNLHNLMPDMFTDSFGFNVFAIANKAQRIANKLYDDDFKALNGSGSETDFTGYVQKTGQTMLTDPPSPLKNRSIATYLNHYLSFEFYQKDASAARSELDPKIDPATGTAAADSPKKASFGEFFDAEFRQGSQFASFKVDHTGAVSESVTNSAVESDLQNKFNSTSSQMREARFSFADGNLSNDMITSTITGAIGAVTDLAAGIGNGMTMNLFSGLAGLAGSGFLDIPKHWQSSNVTLPTATYTMQLRSPYNNPISQMQNLYIPLAMWMAAAFPLATGPQSYTSPFLCQLFDRGRCQIQMGIVSSLSITRGTSNLAFTTKGNALAIDISVQIMDLSSIMTVPISTGSLFNASLITGKGSPMDEDNPLTDYLAVLAGQDVYSQIYALPKAKLSLARKMRRFDRLTNPAYWASLIHEESTTGTLSFLTPGPLLESLVSGSNVVSRN